MRRYQFNHEAMATTFGLTLATGQESYARQAATAAFRELDRLENELSRFIESSDIGRVNRLAADESTVVGEDCLQCLLGAARISALTERAFDPTYLSLPGRDRETEPVMALDPTEHLLTAHADRLTLDLGAVGKGYALDRVAALLREWDINSAQLVAGGSTVAAFSPEFSTQEWPIVVERDPLFLCNQAASASGLSVQGPHIVDPRRHAQAMRKRRVWAFADSAADADALSTAFFVMSDEDVAAFCAQHAEFGAGLLQADGTVRFVGRVPSANPQLSGQTPPR